MSESLTQGHIECNRCKGVGHVKCECPDYAFKTVEGHSLNHKWRDQSGVSSEGFCIQQCRQCGRVRGLYYQWDAGTGSDDSEVDYGFVDPMTITERKPA